MPFQNNNDDDVDEGNLSQAISYSELSRTSTVQSSQCSLSSIMMMEDVKKTNRILRSSSIHRIGSLVSEKPSDEQRVRRKRRRFNPMRITLALIFLCTFMTLALYRSAKNNHDEHSSPSRLLLLTNTTTSLWDSLNGTSWMNTASSFRRMLSIEPPSRTVSFRNPTLVIAGKMSVLGGPCNVAQYNLKSGEWSLSERIQLSLYNSYSGGEVYSLLANYTGTPVTSGSGDLIVVGAFDTTYRNSQKTFCSVGKWDGEELNKVGEGLCNSALSKGMKITTASLAGADNVYVAGSFQTQVWNGDRHEFVQIFNIAHYDAVEQVWSPLGVGQISCSWCTVTVLALAWDEKRRQLHVAGKFNAIDGRNVPAGLAIYNSDTGHLVAHPGGGLSMKNVSQDGVATALQLDQESGVLYVMGSFQRLTQTYEFCGGLAAYEIDADRWTCLADEKHSVTPTGGGNMLLTPYGLMAAGKTTSSSTWPYHDRPYTIALLKDTLKTRKQTKHYGDDDRSDSVVVEEQQYHDFNWSWLPGFHGHSEPLHALSNGFGDYHKSVFIAGDNLVARWSYKHRASYDEVELADDDITDFNATSEASNLTIASVPKHATTKKPASRRFLIDGNDELVPVTERLATVETVRGAIMAM